MTASTLTPRPLVRRIPGMAASDGAGVRLTRLLGTPALPEFDPFLMLDRFHSDVPGDYAAGFPDHPHRGFQTVTYMLAGRMRHWDNHGHGGVIGPGGVQWMRAGRGLIHSEMPEQEDGLLSGFQLWLNLPARDKMSEPAYQEFAPEDFPEEARDGGALVRVVAGMSAQGTSGPVQDPATEARMLDVHLPAAARFEEAVPPGHHVMLVPIEGTLMLRNTQGRDQACGPDTLAVLGDGDRVEVMATDAAVRFLLLAAQPLGEPVARAGPFVMNTRDELVQAMRDYQAGQF
ncbi:pirin family protein [Achromobacter sp. GG226]|uniref:pirin family protein n=1 Tax=Verticiella alkaliphila TaxID=2779529 RepID=UPI001C0CF678|nr:pirin family protein [Verticiella sp. GG226]MBU4612731.1 pirin family protein [Verticiella sp. GG226]